MPSTLSSSLPSQAAALLQHPGLWRGSELARVRTPSQASGFARLDQELPGGGWPTGALSEILCGQQGTGALRLVLPALARLSQAGRRQIWIAPPHEPYAPALAQAGIDLSRLLIMAPEGRRDMLWATEQALRSGAAAAVLLWPATVRDARALDYAESRRLQVAIEGSQALAFIFRDPSEAGLASACALRLSLQPAEAGRLAVRILKRRGHALDAPVLIDAQAGAVAGLRGAGAREGFSTEPGDAVAGDPLPAPSHRINIAGESVS
jgi:hypothetical protein